MKRWQYPGEKLIEKGPESLSDTEILAIIISTGLRDKTSEDTAEKILEKYQSFKGMSHQPLRDFLVFKGLGEAKIVRLAAVFEFAKRVVERVLKDYNGG